MRKTSRFRNFHSLSVTPMWRRGQLNHDLKDTNGVIGFLFGKLPNLSEPQFRCPLSEYELAQYSEKGWVISSKPVLSAFQLNVIRKEINVLLELEEVEDPPNKSLLYSYTELNHFYSSPQLFHCSGAWRTLKGLHDLVYHPSISTVVRQLIGNSTRFLHDELYCKPPKNGAHVPWHQNYIQWRATAPVAHVTAHVAIDSHSNCNGGLQVISGSHLWRNEDSLFNVPSELSNQSDRMEAIKSQLYSNETLLFDQSIESVSVPEGFAVFMHPFLLHGSGANVSSKWRRSVVLHYCNKTTRSLINGSIFPGTHIYAAGDELSNAFHPIVAE